MLYYIALSSLFSFVQAGLIKESPTKEFLEGYARIVIQKNLENLYACGGGDS